jgi:hypothetical protein
MKMPLGKVLMLKEDDNGLFVRAKLSNNVTRCDEAMEQYKDGTLNQHSFGFRYIWDKIEWSEADEAFIVKEVQLFEVSVVTIGANENTPFVGMKSELLVEAREELNREIESLLKSLDPVISYRCRQLISQVKTLAIVEPDIKSTLKNSEPIKIEPKSIDWKKVAGNL